MAMRSGLRKACLLLCMLLLCMTCAAAQAATVSKDGLQVTLKTDKTEYQAGETIDVAVEIVNKGEHLAKVLAVEYLPPSVCAYAQRNAAVEQPALEKSDVLTLTSSFVVMSNAGNEIPQTGDSASIGLWAGLGIVSVLGLGYLGAKRRRELMAIVLCVSLVGLAILPVGSAAADKVSAIDALAGAVRSRIKGGALPAAQENSIGKVLVTQDVSVMGIPREMTAVVTYTTSALSSATYVYSHMLNKPLQETITDATVIRYNMAMDDPGFVLPESEHSYSGNADELYFIRSGAGAQEISLKFGSACEMEYTYDAILIYDAEGNYVDYYTGVSLREKILTMEGGAVIRLVSDSSVNKYGFSLEQVVPHSRPEITGCSISASGKVVVKWNKMNGYTGYIIERAAVSSSGSIGAYTELDRATSNTASYTDNYVTLGKYYAYRIRQYYGIDNQSFLSDYSDPSLIYCIGQPSLTSGSPTTSNGQPAIALKWSAATGAARYRIYRSATENGTFEQIAEVSGTSYSDVLKSEGAYFYKVRGVADYAGKTYTGQISNAACYGFVLPPSTVNIRSKNPSDIILSWPASQMADGYAVFRSTTRTGTYTCIAKTDKTNGTFAPARTNGLSFYKIRAYTITNGKYTYSADSKIVGIYGLGTPTGLTVKENSDATIRLTWTDVANAQSYKIYYSSSQNGTYTECGTTSVKGKTLTTVPETLSTVYFKVRAMRTDGSVTSCSNLSAAVKLTRAVNPINVRNLYIFEENIPDSSPIRTYNGDMNLLNTMFGKASPFGRPVTSLACRDLSKAQIISKIASIANLADANDVTTFFMSCHGANNITSGSQAGMLALSDGSWMTFGELAAELKKIPGRVVIILTSCGSGSAIGNAMRNGNNGDIFDEDSFMQEFINVIAENDEKIYVSQNPSSAVDDTMELPSTGELAVSNKFYVITAARGGESGYYYQDGYTILLEWMNDGVMGADANRDGTVTLGEMQTHLTQLGNTVPVSTMNGAEYMHPQVYPNNSTFTLFKER